MTNQDTTPPVDDEHTQYMQLEYDEPTQDTNLEENALCNYEGFSGVMVCNLPKGHDGQHSAHEIRKISQDTTSIDEQLEQKVRELFVTYGYPKITEAELKLIPLLTNLISDQVAKARIDIQAKLPKRLEGTENWTFETPDLSPADQRALGYNQAIDDMRATLNGVKK